MKKKNGKKTPLMYTLLTAESEKFSNFSWTFKDLQAHELWTKESSASVALIRISPVTTADTTGSVCVITGFGGGVLASC